MTVFVDMLITDYLYQFSPALRTNGSPVSHFHGLWLVGSDRTTPIPLDNFGYSDPMLIAKASQLPAEGWAFNSIITMLCVEDVPIPPHYLRSDKYITVTFPPAVPIADIFNCVNKLYSRTHFIVDGLREYLIAIEKTDDLNNLVRILSNAFNCSMALVSSSLRIISMHEICPSSDLLWKQLKEKGIYNGSQILFECNRRSPDVVIIDHKNGNVVFAPQDAPASGTAFFPIVNSRDMSAIIGFLLVFYADRPLFLINISLMRFASQTLSSRLQCYIGSQVFPSAQVYFYLERILRGECGEQEEIKSKLEHLQCYLKGKLVLIVIGGAYLKGATSYLIQNYLDIFSSLFPKTLTWFYLENILMLVELPPEDNYDFPSKYHNSLLGALQEYKCYAGRSPVFIEIDMTLRNYYYQTLAAMNVAARKNCPIEKFEDIVMEFLIWDKMIPTNAYDYCHPELIRLNDYDKRKGSSYVHTLRCYCKCNKNITKTCEALHIQRNTLFYRLNRIREMINLDINIPAHATIITFSLALLAQSGALLE